MSNYEDRKSRFLQMVGIILFLILMLLIFIRDNPATPGKKVSSSASKIKRQQVRDPKAHAQNVSMHLKDFEKRLEVERQRVQVENMKVGTAPRLDDRITADFPRERGVNLVQERDTILDDIGRSKEEAEVKTGPREHIYSELELESTEENEKVLDNLNLKTDEARYVREVLQRARKDGYELIINKDLVVTGYRKLDPITGQATGAVINLAPPQFGQ